MRNQIYIDFHILQTLPPSCVNRDDTGSPKTAVYGGAMRARVSSQCWKRAMRTMFREMFPQDMVGDRTQKVHQLLTQAIGELDSSVNAEKLAKEALDAIGIKLKEEKNQQVTGALFFISPKQVDALARLAVAKEKDKLKKEECMEALNEEPAIDVALFGRMVADAPQLNYDAAAQVAHAISTHAVHNEYDYFTAMDDCAPEDYMGAGHLGTVEFNSSTLYRYATVNATKLREYLGETMPDAIRGFADAFIRSMPTGKINPFANNMLPNAVYVAIRRDQPLNLVGAFEKPIMAGTDGYVKRSVQALTRHAQEMYRDYLGEPALALGIGEGVEAVAQRMSLDALLDALEGWVREDGGRE